MKAILIITTVIALLAIYFYRSGHQVINVLTPDILQSIDSINIDDIEITAWLWTSPNAFTPEQANKYLDKAEQEHIGTIYVYSDDILSFSPITEHIDIKASSDWDGKAKLLIFEAHKRGIKIHALGGAPNWAYRDHHEEALKFFDYIISYNEKVTSEFRFDGIQFDVEPYGQGNYLGHETPALKSYLDLTQKIAEKYDNAKMKIGEQFQLGFAVPYWFDGEDQKSMLSLDGKGIRGTTFYLMDILNLRSNTYLAIMDYRNSAEGSDGAIVHAQGEIEYAEKFAPNVDIFIGQEITNVLPSKITFYGKGEVALKEEMKKIIRAFSGKSVFKGFSIHTLESYMEFE